MSRWADPRLWVGVLLVLVSLLVGAKVLAAADDSVAVVRVERSLIGGSAITTGDIGVTRVHFEDASDAQQYVSAVSSLPLGARLTRDVAAGELLSVSAVTTDGGVAPQQLPLGVPEAGVPIGLSPGNRVDVWAVPTPDPTLRRSPVSVLRDVTVTAVTGAGPGGLGADRQVLVALPDGADVGRALGLLTSMSVVLIQRDG